MAMTTYRVVSARSRLIALTTRTSRTAISLLGRDIGLENRNNCPQDPDISLDRRQDCLGRELIVAGMAKNAGERTCLQGEKISYEFFES